MARKKKEEIQELKTLTRAQRTDAAKNVIKDLLAVKPHKHNELIESASKIFSTRYVGADNENANDVKGRIGSVLDAMQKSSEIMYDGGMYALKARIAIPAVEEKTTEKDEKPAKKTVKKAAADKEETTEEKPVKKAGKKSAKKKGETAKNEEKTPEKPVKKPAKRAKKEDAVAVEENSETTVETAPKKRGRKPKTVKEEVKEEPLVETPEKTVEIKANEKTGEQPKNQQAEEPLIVENLPVVKEKAELVKPTLVDMSFLLGGKAKLQEKPIPTPQAVKKEEPKLEEKKAEKSAVKKAESQSAMKKSAPLKETKPTVKRAQEKPLTADEKLKENFLKRIRLLGGDYFEYYSVYLLERYSMKNGRRLEGMRVNGGERDGGIDGEIELTDKFGFRETIYVQSKNWDPEKGKEENWVVGETLLQQFIGACACRQARDGKQHCRGIFVTTSRFTPEAKKILETMSDKIVGYDGSDLYEAAKECKFGVIYENGNWKLDEKLLSGEKAFFNML
ncbi:MAG: restriction endonuclease [Clostridia bacterium]|nr:restriction endonuclease [Clostridia bacterium]